MGGDDGRTADGAALRGAVGSRGEAAAVRPQRVEIPERWPKVGVPTLSLVWGLIGFASVAAARLASGEELELAVVAGVVWAVVLQVARWDSARGAAADRAATLRAEGAPPWEADGWRGDAIDTRQASQRGFHLGVAIPSVVLIVVGAPFLLSGRWSGWPGGFAVLASIAVCVLVVLVFARYQQGGVQVRYTQVPCAPGTRATFFVAMTAGGSRLRDTRLVLRCWGPRTGKPPGIVWSQELNPHDDASPGPEEFVEVTFDIPAGLPSNAPHAKKPVHWHLVVAGRTNWGKVVEFMPVPVYDTAGAAPDATGGAR